MNTDASMRLLVPVRRVPDSRAPITLRPDGGGPDPAGLRFVCDPFAEIALAAAVRLREEGQAVAEIVALAGGGDGDVEVLRHALAMGADRAVLAALDEGTMADDVSMAVALADPIRGMGAFDLVLCGVRHIDTDGGAFGPALAECLDLPHVGGVVRLDATAAGQGVLDVTRRVEGALERFTVRLPVLLTCERGLVEPKSPPLPRIMKAKRDPIHAVSAGASRAPAPIRVLPLPPRPACTFLEGAPDDVARELVRRLREEARVL